MELKTPKPKKNAPVRSKFDLPLQKDHKIVGVFNGQHVTISDWDSMCSLYYGGNFGKGTLSKGAPNYHIKRDDIPKILFEQQFKNHSKWKWGMSFFCPQKHSGCLKSFQLSQLSVDEFLQYSFRDKDQESWRTWKEKHKMNPVNSNKDDVSLSKRNLWLMESSPDENTDVDICFSEMVNDILQMKQCKKLKTLETKEKEEVIVVNVNSDATDVCVSSVNSRLEKLPILVEESLNLTLEESLFLKFSLGCLNIIDLNHSELSETDLWERFNDTERNFTQRYVAYHYYRSKGWIPKPGLKFGGDYLLYKDGPAYYHASYLVQVLDKKRKLSWREFIAINRLVETFNKDLIFCEVSPNKPLTDKETFPGCLQNYCVQEVLARRWFPSKERIQKEENT